MLSVRRVLCTFHYCEIHREVNIVGFVGCQFMDFYGRKTDILPSFIRLVSQEVCLIANYERVLVRALPELYA